MPYAPRLRSLALLLFLAACNRTLPAPPENEGMIVAIPGMGPMRCMPLGSAPLAASALPLDLPRAVPGEAQRQLGVDLYANGDTSIDGTRLDDDGALLARAREAIAQSPQLRAIIRADAAVSHGRVIRVLDLLKQAGISKIAFGVTAIPADGGAGDGG